MRSIQPFLRSEYPSLKVDRLVVDAVDPVDANLGKIRRDRRGLLAAFAQRIDALYGVTPPYLVPEA